MFILIKKEVKLTDKERKEAKQRIFDAAASLFAQKGYDAVGVREIAKKADVNISMINYYYREKAGILKEIINECYSNYFQNIKDVGDESMPLDEHFRLMVKTVVNFFRIHTEIALVSFDAIPLDTPEILGLKVKWAMMIRKGMRWFHKKMGLDPDDLVQLNLGPGALVAIVYSHFQSRYSSEHFPLLKEYTIQYDDEFYERFSEGIANLFLQGLKGVKVHKKRKKGGKK
jgi:AcrR family transcriptional regulator